MDKIDCPGPQATADVPAWHATRDRQSAPGILRLASTPDAPSLSFVEKVLLLSRFEDRPVSGQQRRDGQTVRAGEALVFSGRVRDDHFAGTAGGAAARSGQAPR